ncbi:MAG TPA: MurR/RpiR family transcriptional regulator [Bryobacteraceae bacterium]|nr:MurR/RpiR family transcriptional regulator [Bryobacteraceae bacterium]
MHHAGSKLSSRRRQLLASILNNAEETYYLSSRKMARKYGVDAATIVRTIQVLGYGQFAEFASDLRSHFVTRITPYRTMKSATREGHSVEGHVQNSLEMDRSNLEALRAGVPPERVVELARKLIKARQILVVGVDLAFSPAWFLAYSLSWLGLRAEAPVGSSGNLHHHVRSLGPGDIVVAISFGRCLRETVEAARVARERRVWTFGITDAGNSPIALTCHDHWVLSVTNPSFNGSYVALLAALNALLVACAHVRSRRSLKRLREIDREEAAARRWYTPDGAPEKK